jgi:peroxiredoxin Q/BCP
VEACEFRDQSKNFAGKDAVIVGISPDAVKPQAKFKEKFGLPFTLLCDVDKQAAQAYGVYKEKNMYGKKVMGIERTTLIIGADGRIAKIFPKVKAQGHAQQVLDAL